MLRGTLDDFTLPDIFRLVSLAKRTGRLEVVRNAGDGKVFFRDGDVYYAESSLSREPLGQKLIRGGVLSEDELRKALDEHATTGKRVGEILVSTGSVTQDELEGALRDQIEQAVFDLLRWELGEFTWSPNEALDVEVHLGVTVENVIMEASRRLDELKLITRKIPSEHAVLAMSPKPPEGATQINITPEEWRMLVLVDGARSVGEIGDVVGLDVFHAMRVLYGLASAGLIDVVSHDGDDAGAGGEPEEAWIDAAAPAPEPLVVEQAPSPEPVVEHAPSPEPVVEAAPPEQADAAVLAEEAAFDLAPSLEGGGDWQAGSPFEFDAVDEPRERVDELPLDAVAAPYTDVSETDDQDRGTASSAPDPYKGEVVPAVEPDYPFLDDVLGGQPPAAPEPEEAAATPVAAPEAPAAPNVAASPEAAPPWEAPAPPQTPPPPEPWRSADDVPEPPSQEAAADRAEVARELSDLFSDRPAEGPPAPRENTDPSSPSPAARAGTPAPGNPEDDDETRGLISRLIDGVKGL